MKKPIMKKQVGVWLDHRQAVIVSSRDGVEKTKVIESNVGPRVTYSGGTRSKTPYGPQGFSEEKQREAKYYQKLDAYYHEVIRAIRNADEILIFGPGEAKIEFKKAISKEHALRNCVVALEPADKMTERQIAAKVREHFGMVKSH
jgi:hypothetical protein